MSLISDLKRVKTANQNFIEWVKSLKTNGRKTDILFDIGIQLKKNGVSVKKIPKAYFQLADHHFVKLDTLTNDTIEALCLKTCRSQTTDTSEDEYNDSVSSGNSCAEDNDEIRVNDVGKPQDILSAENEKFKEKDCTSSGKNEEQNKSIENDNNLPSNASSSLNEGSTTTNSSIIDKPQINEQINFSEQEDTYNSTRLQKNIQPFADALQESSSVEISSKNHGTEIHLSCCNNTSLSKNPTQETCSLLDSRPKSAESVYNAVEVTSDTVKEGKSVMEKPEDIANVDVTLNTVKKNNHGSLKFQEKGLNSNSLALKPLDQQSEMTSCILTNSENSTLSKPSNDSNHIKNKDDLKNVGEKIKSSNSKIKSINRKEIMAMFSLKEQIEKNLSEKNLPLRITSTNNGQSREDRSSLLTGPNKPIRNNQNPKISITTSMENIEETLECSETSSIQCTKNGQGGSQISGIVNVKEPQVAGSSVKERYEHSPSTRPLEGLKQMNSQLHTIKKMAELRKRLSEDSGNKIQTVKKRRFSAQNSTGQEITMGEVHLDCHEGTLTYDISINKEQIQENNSAIPNDHSLNSNRDISKSNSEGNPNTNSVNVNLRLSPKIAKESNQTCVTNNLKPSTNEQIPRIRCVKDSVLFPDYNFNSNKSLSVSNTNTSVENPVRIIEREANKSSNLVLGTTVSAGRDINKTSTSNLINKPSVTVTEAEKLSESPPTLQSVPTSVINSVAKERIPPHSNSALETAVNESGCGLVPNNKQSSVNKTLKDKTHLTMSSSNFPTLRNFDLVDEAVKLFRTCFCNNSDEILSQIPKPVCLSVKQYCINQSFPHLKNLTAFLKVYMGYYIKIFNNPGFRMKINKIAELLHLSIADMNRQRERNDKALKLQSEILRKGEMDRANKDYYDILAFRGKQFSNMFGALLPVINLVKGCEFLMLTTFYFKTTQALIKIDPENDKYVFIIRKLMESLLKNGLPSLLEKNLAFFNVDLEDFKDSYCFVKKSLLTLYLSGYSEVETEFFFESVCCEPTIPNFFQILSKLNQTVMQNFDPNSTVYKQMLSLLQKNLHADIQNKLNPQAQINFRQQTNQSLNSVSDSSNRSNLQYTPIETQEPPQRTTLHQSTQQQGAQQHRSYPSQNSIGQNKNQQQPQDIFVNQRKQQVSYQDLSNWLQQQVQQPGQSSLMLHTSQQPPPGTLVQHKTQQPGQSSLMLHTSQQRPPGTLVQHKTQQPDQGSLMLHTIQQRPPGTWVQHKTQQPDQSSLMLHANQQRPSETLVQHKTQQPGQSSLMQHTSQPPQSISSHQRIQQPQDNQTPVMVGVKMRSPLPAFASLNQPQRSFQNLPQSNILTSSGGQTRDFTNQPTQLQRLGGNHGSSITSSQPQWSRSHTLSAAATCPNSVTQAGSVNYTRCNQSRELVHSNNNMSPLSIRIPAPSQQQQVTENVAQNIPSEMTLTMPCVCFLDGCARQATLVCSLCRKALYCTTDCQTQHWYKGHSETCLKLNSNNTENLF